MHNTFVEIVLSLMYITLIRIRDKHYYTTCSFQQECALLPYCPISLVGKTESTKMTIAQLARMSKSQEPTKLAEQIVEVGSFTK